MDDEETQKEVAVAEEVPLTGNKVKNYQINSYLTQNYTF